MKNLTSLFMCFVLFCSTSYAQIAPDNEQILRATIDSNSEYYYPSIHSRYILGDTTLTLQDYHYLYYGYAYRDGYNPLESIPAEITVLSVLERNPNLDSLGAVELLLQCKEVMKADPFSLKNINFMTYAYSVMGDDIGAAMSADRFNKVFKTIENSGTGTREKTPLHLLWASHAGDFIAAKNLEYEDRRVVSRTVEYVTLAEKDGDIKGYYFDFGRMYWKRPERVESKKSGGGWMFNGLKL